MDREMLAFLAVPPSACEALAKVQGVKQFLIEAPAPGTVP